MANEKVELLEDFSGGNNYIYLPSGGDNRIDANQASATQNVYYKNNSITKRAGRTATAMTVGSTSGAVGFRGFEIEQLVIGGTTTLFIAGTDVAKSQITVKTGTTIDADVAETTGTVSTTSGSTAVTGSGTFFTRLVPGANGDIFRVNADGTYRTIASIASDTAMTLSSNYPSTNSNAAWKAIARWPYGATGRIRFAALNGTLYIVSSYSLAASARTWDGTNLGIATEIPQAKYITVFKNYLFTGNTSTNPSRIQWSKLLDATIFPSTNFIDVSPKDGQQVRGIFVAGNSLIILKDNSAYSLTGDVFDPSSPTYTLSQIPTPSDFYIDTSRTVQFFNGAYIMRGVYGLYAYDGSAIEKIDKKGIMDFDFANSTSPIFDTAGSADTILYESSSAIVAGRYWSTGINLRSTGKAYNCAAGSEIIVYDENGAYWDWYANENSLDAQNAFGPTWTDFSISAASAAPTVYAVDVNNSYLLTMDSGSADLGVGTNTTANIRGQYATKTFQFPNKQQFLYAYLYYKKQTASASFSGTGTVTTAVSSTAVVGAGTSFTTEFTAGSTITVNGTTGTVASVTDATNLVLTANFGALNTGVAFTGNEPSTVNLTFRYYIDKVVNTATVDMAAGTAPANSPQKSAKIVIGQVGNTIGFELINSVLKQSFEIYGIEYVRRDLKI